jgi:hypothetical protein
LVRLVAGVDPKWLVDSLKVFAEQLAAKRQKWANECGFAREWSLGWDAAQARQRATAEQTHGHRFGLVVGRVCEREVSRAKVTGDLFEKVVSDVAKVGFPAAAARFLELFGSPNSTLDSELLRQVAHKLLVLFAFLATQSVIAVGEN